MTPTDEIEPMVPELPREREPLTDGGRRRPRAKTFDDPEDDAPLVPDLS